ncbi:hypothetical protein AZE42_01205 [Rhizopogon vesiculosus]|uniref:Uncharacterized protein n=1 Tax=Rhizopogon vesiculosus TaxID=180088 RepID=A0A1J8QW53_9AGAM|nr:hypothetical protein AZE42_01205 [Rhizopogon vesiculosus]
MPARVTSICTCCTTWIGSSTPHPDFEHHKCSSSMLNYSNTNASFKLVHSKRLMDHQGAFHSNRYLGLVGLAVPLSRTLHLLLVCDFITFVVITEA